MIIIKDLIQGSEAWFAEKIGKPSASNASMIITNEGKPSKQRDGYLYTLAAERLTGKQENGYKNAAMEGGQEREDESRNMFSLIHNVDIEKVGVIYKDDKKRFLCSPDRICKNFGLELKNPLGKTQVKYLLDCGLPSDYFGQVQFSLYVTGFPKWYFMSFVPSMKPLILEVRPDVVYQKSLAKELDAFCDELDKTVERIRK